MRAIPEFTMPWLLWPGCPMAILRCSFCGDGHVCHSSLLRDYLRCSECGILNMPIVICRDQEAQQWLLRKAKDEDAKMSTEDRETLRSYLHLSNLETMKQIAVEKGWHVHH